MRLLQSFVLILVGFAAVPAFGLDPDRSLDDYLHQHWSIPEGLPQNSINGMALGPGGYLWLATYEGLARFDGDRFVHKDHEDLPGRRLTLHAGDEDGLWIGGNSGGLVYFDGEEVHPVEIPDDDIHWPVSDVLVHQDQLWVAAMDGVHLIADEGHGDYIGRHPGLIDRHVIAVDRLADGRVVLGTDVGLHIQEDGLFRPWLDAALPSEPVHRLLPEGDGFLVSAGPHVFYVEDGQAHPVHVETEDPRAGLVLALARDGDGNLWIGQRSGDVIRVTSDGRSDRHSGDGLHHSVESFLEDREGNLWIGTDGNGLHRIRDGKAISHGGPGSPVGGPMMAVTEHPEGGLLAGGHCSGLVHYQERKEQARWTEEDGLDNTCVAGVLADQEEHIWVATNGGGVFRSSGEGFAPVAGAADEGIFFSLFEDREGRIWLGGWDGLFVFDPESERFEPLPAVQDVHVHSMHQDEQGRLWLATSDGVYFSEAEPTGSNPDLELRFEHLGAEEGLPDEPVRDVHFDTDGVWFALFGGGLVYWSDEEATVIGPEDGLAEDIVSRILTDDQGNFWLSGHQGISRVPREQLHELMEGERDQVQVELLGAADGLRVTETNGGGQPAGIRRADGSLWFPTVDGLIRILPDRIRRNSVPPRMHIESVAVDGEDRSTEGPVVMGPEEEDLEIRYTAVSFTSPEEVRFEYRLQEDKSWVNAGSLRQARIARPDGGEYTFRVRARNEEGVQSVEMASFDLVVEPRFRETLWFPLSLFTGGAMLILLLFAGYLLQARLRRRQLEREVIHQTRELRKANRKLEKQARVDGLTGVGNRRHLTTMLEREWRQCRRDDTPLSVAIFDIDRFKAFNDSAGHLEGDDCLRQVARCLEDSMRRPSDLLTRFGGEEFVVLLPDTDAEIAMEIAERLRQRVEALAIPHPDSDVAPHVTVSVGVAGIRPRHGDGIMEVLQAADEALYVAKEAGRNRTRRHGDGRGDPDQD